MNRTAICLALAILALAGSSLPGFGSAAPVHLAPHPLVGGVSFVRAAGFTAGTNGVSVTATVNATSGDTIYAFGGEGFAVGTPAFNDSRSFTWATNFSKSLGGFGIVLGHANVTTSGLDTVTFADSGSGALTLGLWDVHGSAGRFAHEGNGSSGTSTSLADSVWVHNSSGLVGFFDVAARATGGCSNAADPGLTYAVGGNSISSSDASCGLFAAPTNGTGFLPVDGGTNSTTSQAGIAFSIDPASAPPAPVAAISSHGPSPCEVGSCRAIFNGSVTGGTAPFNFSWAWGDGSGATHDNGNSTGSDRTTHTFATAGRFNVSVTVTDAHGATSTANVTQIVRGTLTVSATANRTSPCEVALANATCSVTFLVNASFGLASYSSTVRLYNSTGSLVASSNASGSTTAAVNATLHETLPVGTFTLYYNVTDGQGHTIRTTLTFVVAVSTGGGALVSGGMFDLILIGSVVLVLAFACVGMAAGHRRRRGPR